MAIYKIALSDIEKCDIVITKNMTDNQVYAKYKPDYLLNLALYDMTTGKNIVYMEDENKADGYLFSSEGLGIKRDGMPVWCDKDEAYKTEGIKDYVSFSPVLVKDGIKSIDWGNKVSSYVNGNHYRSFTGLSDTHLFVGCSDNKNTIDGLANYCVQQGMKHAGNNDGNGSQSLWIKGKPIKDSVRKNASWLMVWLKKDIDKPQVDKEEEEMVTKSKVMVNGIEKDCDVIVKDGTTYIKLRDIADSQIVVDYDAAKKIPKVDIKK